MTGCELLVGNDPANPGDGGGAGVGINDDAGGHPNPESDASGDDGSSSADVAPSTTDAGASGPDATTSGQDASTTGQDSGAVKPDATSAPDATADATAASGDGGALCGLALPGAWSVALFNPNASSCPANFAPHIVDGPPTVGAGACSCQCTVSQQGTCSHGAITLMGAPGHGVDTCTSPWSNAPAGGSACVAVPATAFDSISATVSGSGSGTGGACTSQATPNPAALTVPTQVYCDVPSTSADAVCSGSVPTGFSACIVTSGDVACPASTPFVQKFSVEALNGASLSCGNCTACSVSTSCASPTIDAFTNGTCAGTPALHLPADGTCIASGEQAFASVQYNASPNTACTAGTSTATVQRTGQQTICCR